MPGGGLTIIVLLVIGGFCLSGAYFGQRRAEKLQTFVVTERPDFFRYRLTPQTVIGWICILLAALLLARDLYRFIAS